MIKEKQQLTLSDNMHFGQKDLYINGELVPASDNNYFSLICPGTEEETAKIAWATKKDTEQTLLAAEEGFKMWSQTPVEERIEWIAKLRSKLFEYEDLLRTSIMHEMGKVWEGTEEDFKSITDSLAFYSEEIIQRQDIPIADKEGTHTHHIKQQPVGVVIAFIAYNFPLLNLGFKLGPAIAAGCSIILKPSEFSPLSAYILGEILHEINFPKGVINIICGDVANVGIPLCESKIPRLVTMIGSTETAQKLIQQSSKTSIKRYSMECGGNAPFIVFDDADIDKAATIGAALKIGNTGQICVAANRYYVHEAVLQEFLDKMKSHFEAATLGFGREGNPSMGPLANMASVIKVKGIVDKALNQGGQLLFGGKAPERKGYYFEPTLILLPDANLPILKEEVFGPVAMIVPFKSKEEVLGWANDSDAGLASYVFSENSDILAYFAEHLEFGEVQLNGVKYDIYLPHGGVKNSGIGVDCSSYAMDDYLTKKRVTLDKS